MESALVEEARFWLLADLLDADRCWVLTLCGVDSVPEMGGMRGSLGMERI